MKMCKLIVGAAVALGVSASAAVAGDASVARRWNELLLEAVRHDLARPTVHARNLYHTSAAIYDAWAAFDPNAAQVIAQIDGGSAADVVAAQEEALSYAAYRVLINRFSASPGAAGSVASFMALMAELGYDPAYTSTTGGTPADIGNSVGAAIIAHGLLDGSNQQNGYANQQYASVNPPMIVVDFFGNPWTTAPSRYQPLALDYFVDQSGNPIPGGFPPFLSPEWGFVTPFSLTASDRLVRQRDGHDWWVYLDPGPVPTIEGADAARFISSHAATLAWSAQLDPADGVMIDIAPSAMSASMLPANPADDESALYQGYLGPRWGPGHALNPITGQAYAPDIVKRGDFARVLAEFWADGPQSETPPGHWFTILNAVNDNLASRRWAGAGPELSRLEWDVKSYLVMGGAMHDTAISIWSVKGYHDASRPITSIRYMAMKGQSSDPSGPSYHAHGLPLVPGLIELITPATTAVGQRHESLAGYEGELAALAWRGPTVIGDPAADVAGCGWVLAGQWWSYQRPSFVTPPFAGYVSGHSGYSRCAAELLEEMTGSIYFPGGMGVFNAIQNQYLVFEDGPSQTVQLQWATFQDAAAQSAYSRIWGGIHPPMDDAPARRIGRAIAPKAFARATELFTGSSDCVADITGNGVVDGADLGMMLSAWGACDGCAPDLNGDGVVGGPDLGTLLAGWGACQ